MYRVLSVALLIIVAAAAHVGLAQPSTSIAIVNARVFTGVEAQPWAEAVAVRGDRIVAVGTSEEIREAAGAAARVIDAGGRLMIPGINDAHTHPGTYPKAVQLEGPPAMEQDPPLAEVLKRLKAAVARAPKGGWIFGEVGSAALDDPGATRFALDKIAPDRLVMLGAWTGHGTWFNTAALRHLGVSDTQADPPGGFFNRMPDGKTLSGIAHEYAEYRLRQNLSMEVPRDGQMAAALGFGREAAGFGITSAQAMLTSGPPWFMTPFLVRDEMPVRVRPIDFPMSEMKAWRTPPAKTGAPVPGVKWIMDGTPLERLAAMREPYADAKTRGGLNFESGDLEVVLRRALEAGVQPMLHIAGDRAMDVVLDALDATGGEKWRPLRPRLEHGEMLQPDHYARAKRVGAVLVINPSHYMIPKAIEARLGPVRGRTFGAVKSALDAGIPVAIGSDGPINPYLNIMFAILHPGNPPQALSREQALVAYTRGAAFAELQETEKGTIAPGMLADLAVLSQDIFKVPTPALPGTTSVLTLVGGRIVHEGR
jgi:predicted amidohydrolase YtcJ